MADDPFAMLGLPRSFRIDRGDVQRAYLARAAMVHPDFVGLEDEGSGGQGDASAELNRARETLENPEVRAGALLKLVAGEAGVRFLPADERALPPGFLMEMMETREQMEADRAAGDSARLAAWERWAEERRKQHQENVAGLFDAAMAKPEGATLKSIRLELNAWRYVERMIEQLAEPAP